MALRRQTSRVINANHKKTKPSRTAFSSKLSELQRRTAAFVVTHRKIILLVTIVLILILETVEHIIIKQYGETIHLWFDALIYVPFIPAVVWILLSLLEHAASEHAQAAADSDLRQAFSQQLGDASSWEELINLLVAYPNQIAPQTQVTLYLYNPLTNMLEPEATCTRDGSVTHKPSVSLNSDTVPVGSLSQLLRQNDNRYAFPRSENASSPIPLPPHRFDLPVIRNDQTIGVFKLEYLPGQSPSQAEIRALKAAAPVMALALEVGLLQNLSAEQAAASVALRQQIAQTLHDTLAQNISYLRLKLDQLTGENAIREIGVVLQELERMRDTADEAYQQVRNTLEDLNPLQGEDLPDVLSKHARAIATRAGFILTTSLSGTPYPLPSFTRQQIVYILREALHNIEKHAQAAKVQLQILWLENELIIKITDDGIGFDVHTVSVDGHFGLWIMQHRAQEIDGTLKISQAEEHGTEVTLWVPRPFSITPKTTPSAEQKQPKSS